MDAVTQRAKILAYCEQHGSITVREAFNLGINSPTKRISEIRKSGEYNVDTVNERNDKSRWKRYYIKEKGDER